MSSAIFKTKIKDAIQQQQDWGFKIFQFKQNQLKPKSKLYLLKIKIILQTSIKYELGNAQKILQRDCDYELKPKSVIDLFEQKRNM